MRDISTKVSSERNVIIPKTSFLKKIKKAKAAYLVVLPGLLYFLIIKYMPLYFIQVAFKEYRITRSIAESPWVGFVNFVDLFKTPGFFEALSNTFTISLYKIIFGFPIPIILALLLNEVRSHKFKRISQSIVYLPHFISWTIVGGIVYNLLSVNGGLVNQFLGMFNVEPIFFMGNKSMFKPILVITDIWREAGYGSILYLAALTRIDSCIYEAADIDGAGRLKKLIYITLPGISSTIVILLIIKIGHSLNVGAEEILVMSNPMVRSAADVIDTFVYRIGLQQGNHSIAAAAGLFKAVVAGLMVFGADRIAKRLGDSGLL